MKKASEQIAACISSLIYWPRFKIIKLCINMRLFLIRSNTIMHKTHFIRQKEYTDSILAIGAGRDDNYSINLNTDCTGSIMKVGLSMMSILYNI